MNLTWVGFHSSLIHSDSQHAQAANKNKQQSLCALAFSSVLFKWCITSDQWPTEWKYPVHKMWRHFQSLQVDINCQNTQCTVDCGMLSHAMSSIFEQRRLHFLVAFAGTLSAHYQLFFLKMLTLKDSLLRLDNREVETGEKNNVTTGWRQIQT